MIQRAIQAEVPFAWVAADSIYGVGEIELALRRAYKGYVLGVTGQHRFWSWDANLDVAGTAADIAKSIPDQDWLRLSAGAGSKGARLFDWAYLPLATLRADALDAALDQSLWTRGLLVRRSLSDGALAYFTTWCPAGTPVEKLVMVEGRRSRDRGRVRDRQDGTWAGPQREPLVAWLAPACQLGDAGLRDAGAGAPAGQRAAPKNDAHRQARRCRGPFRRSDAWRCGWRSAALSPPSCPPSQLGGAPTKLPLDRRISEGECNCNASCTATLVARNLEHRNNWVRACYSSTS